MQLAVDDDLSSACCSLSLVAQQWYWNIQPIPCVSTGALIPSMLGFHVQHNQLLMIVSHGWDPHYVLGLWFDHDVLLLLSQQQ